MTGKFKLMLLLLFIILLPAIYFLLWKNKVFAPHTISIQNNDDVADVANNNDPITTNSAAVISPENTPETARPSEIIPQKETEPVKKLSESSEKNPATNTQLLITNKLTSWGFSTASNRKIDTIIIHSSYNALGGDEYGVEKLISEYKEYGVAPHYLIDREGKIYLLVEEKNIAYHAGESKVPDNRNGVNNFSLGIEMINTEEDKYTGEQYAVLNSLLSNLKSRYSIKYVLGHKDISPGRKTDPWNFDWKKIN